MYVLGSLFFFHVSMRSLSYDFFFCPEFFFLWDFLSILIEEISFWVVLDKYNFFSENILWKFRHIVWANIIWFALHTKNTVDIKYWCSFLYLLDLGLFKMEDFSRLSVFWGAFRSSWRLYLPTGIMGSVFQLVEEWMLAKHCIVFFIVEFC